MFRHSLINLFFSLSFWALLSLARRDNIVHPGPYHTVERLRGYETNDGPGFVTPSRLRIRQNQTNTGLTAVDTFTYDGETWTVYEDLTRFDGPLILKSSSGKTRELRRYVEPTTLETQDLNRTVEDNFGLDPANDVNLKLNDVLAERLLRDGEPVEEHVRDVVQMAFLPWDTFLGTVEASDTMSVDWQSMTKNYMPLHELTGIHGSYFNFTWDGLLGGWLPSSRKIYRKLDDEKDWIDITAFADVDSRDPDMVHVWFSTKWIQNGVVRANSFALDYKEFLPLRAHPTADDFYPALLRYADYWESKVQGGIDLTLPDQTWADMGRHAFAVELVQRPSGVWPRYGTFDRDYGGSEYDGFQDVFTTSVTANLVWGRFSQAKAVIENYMDWYVRDNGDVKMRGPEVPQFGLSLSLIARYVQYTGDAALAEKYKPKMLAWADALIARHETNLKLPEDDPYHGLISGWSESDAALRFDASRFEKPYWNNAAFAARGLKDLGKIDAFAEHAQNWTSRAERMINQTAKTLDRFVQRDLAPPYVPVLANETAQVIDDMTNNPDTTPQVWAHRVYAELLHASVLPANLADVVIDSMQAYGVTSLGVVANMTPLKADTRDMLGFISYGYALSLLLRNRVDEFVLFLYSHRYHVHNRGLWIAAEVAGTGGGASTYCQPAEFAVPILLRAALVLEHPDEEVLFVARGVPRRWLGKGPVGVRGAPTRWGKVDVSVRLDEAAGSVTAEVSFERAPPAEVRVRLGVPGGSLLKGVTVDGVQAAEWEGDEVTVRPESKSVTVEGKF